MFKPTTAVAFPRYSDAEYLEDQEAESLARSLAEQGQTCCLCGNPHPVTISLDGTDDGRVCADHLGDEVALRLSWRRRSLASTVEAYTRKLVETGAVVRRCA